MKKKLTVFLFLLSLGILFSNKIYAQAVPQLSVPANTSTWELTTPTLYWWYVPYIYSTGPFNYQVQLGISPSDFSAPNLIVNQTVTGSNSAYYTVPSGLLGVGSTYYWRIGINGYYSQIWSFTPSVGGSGGTSITLTAPVLVSPTDASFDIASPVLFSWNSVSNATNYKIQIATDNAFTILVKDTITSSTSVSINGLQSLTTYYWKVRAQNSNGISPWSSIFSFTSELTPPSIVTLLAPLNNSISYVTNPVLQWSSVLNSDTYELQISTNNLFSIIVYASSGITDSQKQVSGLLNNTQYYWRVRAVNTAGPGSWSYASKFTVNVPLPATPVSIYPDDNKLNVPTSSTFSWFNVQYSDSFNIQIAMDDFFSNLVVDSTVADTSVAVSNLNYSTNYFWRVRAKNTIGYGNWAQLRFFRTRKAPPSPPILISPLAGSFPTNFEFQWTNGLNSSEVNRYKMQVSLTGSFVTGVKTYNNINTTSKLVEGLFSQSNYYWRVKAYTPTDSSDWSVVGSFNTNFNPKNYYVNGSTGDDFLNDGSFLKPFKTINRAFGAVNINSFDTVHVADGYYPEELNYPGGFALVGGAHTSLRSISFAGTSYKYVKNFTITYDPSAIFNGLLAITTSNIYLENISTSGFVSSLIGIYIMNSTNIKIKNCTFDQPMGGIRIINSSYIELNNVKVNGVDSNPFLNSFGLVIYDSDNIDVSKFSVHGMFAGIILRNVSDSDFDETTILNCSMVGLFIGPSNNLTFNKSVIDNSSRGIWIEPTSGLFATYNVVGGNTNTIKDNGYFSVKSVNSFTTSDNISFTGHSEIKNNISNGAYAFGNGGIYSVNGLSFDGDINFTNNGSVGFYNAQLTLRGEVNDPLIKGCTFNSSTVPAVLLYSDSPIATPSGVKINNNIFDILSASTSIVLTPNTTNRVDGRNNSFPNFYSFNMIDASIIDSLDNPLVGFVDRSGSTFGSGLGPTIALESISKGYKGASYYLDVDLTADSNAYNFLKGKFYYDTTFVKYLGYVSDGLINQSAWSSLNVSDSTIFGSNHVIKFSAFGLTPITQNGTLFRLYFKIQSSTPSNTTAITANTIEFYGNNIPGAFVIVPSTIMFSNPPGPVQSKGDVTLDAVVTMDDFMALLYHLNGTQLLTDPQALINADFNSDNVVNQQDLNDLYTFLNPGSPIVNPNVVQGQLAIANISYKNETSANIPLTIKDAADVKNLVVHLNYDPKQVTFHAFEKNDEISGIYVYGYENKPGEAVFVLQSRNLLRGTIVPGDIKVGFVENHLPIGSIVTTKYSVNGNEFVAGPNFRFDYNGITGIEENQQQEELPTKYDLSQNYPNPFNPSTKINYSLPNSAYVRIIVYDILGREVKTLVNAEQNAGRYTLNWNSDDNYGNRVASGIYIYRIVAGNFVSTKKMMLLK
jgi:hypothetical protein